MQIRGSLLLAKKYMINTLFDRLSSVIERDWPSQLEAWRMRQAEIDLRISEDEDEDDEEYGTVHSEYCPDPGLLFAFTCV